MPTVDRRSTPLPKTPTAATTATRGTVALRPTALRPGPRAKTAPNAGAAAIGAEAGTGGTAALRSAPSRPPPLRLRPPPEPAPPAAPAGGFGHPEGTGRRLADLPGIDPALVEGLANQDIDTIADLLLTAPSALERPPRVSLSPPSEGAVLVRGALGWRRILLSPGHRRVELLLSLKDGQTLRCRWLGDEPRGWSDWTAGTVLALVGELGEDDDGPVLYNAEPVGIDGRGSGLLASYGLEGVDDRALRSLIARCLSEELGHLEDWLPAGILEEQRLLPLDEALRDAHFPANGDGRGRVRLAYEELLTIQLGIAWRAGRGTGERGFAHKILHRGVGQLDSQHSITLNDGQEQAFNEIRRDLLRPRPMARLLQGDVGAGKGLVALMSAVMVAEAGGQVVIVAPDALAAERRFLHAEALLRSLGVVPLLVAGAPDHAAADALRRGEAHVVFGTGALLDPRIEWKRLGLVIAEERGPYGTVQRATLEGRSPRPDLLVVTRSPIPTSLVFTVFGDFDVSVVLAEGRLRTLCAVHPATERSAAYAHARNAVKAGRQAFVVFPVRDGRDLLGREDALRMAKALQADVLQGARVGVYSSEMPREERTRAFDDFHHRRIDVLVCTTFIEDAPAVANASVMVVEYADLHNLVRLHRLRGHVDAGNLPGHCDFVLSDDPSAEGLRVVEQVVSERDGFRLAEVDLEIRGNVALLGDRADEVPDLHWAEPARDRQLLLRARAEAFRLLGEDPGLRRSKTLQRAVLQRWGDWLDRHIAPDESRRATPADGRKADPTAVAAADSAGRRRRRRRRR